MQTIQLLPLLLAHGKTLQVPIVIAGCKRLVLHELIYRNKFEEDLIKECKVWVGKESVTYQKSESCAKTYFINGTEGVKRSFHIDPATDTEFRLEVSCENFTLCKCKEHRFQLNISASYK